MLVSGNSCPARPSPSVTVSAVDTINDPSVLGLAAEGGFGKPSLLLLTGAMPLISIVRGVRLMRREVRPERGGRGARLPRKEVL